MVVKLCRFKKLVSRLQENIFRHTKTFATQGLLLNERSRLGIGLKKDEEQLGSDRSRARQAPEDPHFSRHRLTSLSSYLKLWKFRILLSNSRYQICYQIDTWFEFFTSKRPIQEAAWRSSTSVPPPPLSQTISFRPTNLNSPTAPHPSHTTYQKWPLN